MAPTAGPRPDQRFPKKSPRRLWLLPLGVSTMRAPRGRSLSGSPERNVRSAAADARTGNQGCLGLPPSGKLDNSGRPLPVAAATAARVRDAAASETPLQPFGRVRGGVGFGSSGVDGCGGAAGHVGRLAEIEGGAERNQAASRKRSCELSIAAGHRIPLRNAPSAVGGRGPSRAGLVPTTRPSRPR